MLQYLCQLVLVLCQLVLDLLGLLLALLGFLLGILQLLLGLLGLAKGKKKKKEFLHTFPPEFSYCVEIKEWFS